MRLLPIGPTTRIVIRWLFVILGILAALAAPVAYRDGWVGQDPPAPAELTMILQTTGVACLALILVLSSFTALRSARIAGIMLLAATPMLAFALAYSEAGFMAAGADGEIVFRLPPPGRAAAMAVSFYLPFVVLFAARKRRYAFLFLLASVLPIAFLLAVVRGAAVLVPGLARNSALLLVFGTFWLGTHWLGWPALRTAPGRWSGRLCMTAVVCLLIAFLLIGGAVAGSAMGSSLWTPDCSGSGLFARPLSSSHVVITARILRTAHTNKIAGSWAGSWAIGIVKERFWGLPSWVRVVLLTNSIYWEDKTYLVSGFRAYGALARLLPIVDATHCGGVFAAPVGDVGPELRLLREAPAEGERRIVGNVLAANPSHWKESPPGNVAPQRSFHSWRNHENKELYEWELNQPHHSLPGARISLTGPSGTTILTTDQDGIFELANLPPATYTLHVLDLPAYQYLRDLTLKKEALATPGLSRMNLIANWMGMMEGTVTDAAGRPVAALVELRNPDGSAADRSIGDCRLTAVGAFRCENLPTGGRYLVLMNRFGPSIQSPYPLMYYPSARRPEDAQVFEVKGAEGNRHVDFHVVRLQERKLSVRATWPDGRPLVDGSITVVNVQPKAYDDLAGPANSNEFPTNNDGVAEVRVFGDTRVRLQARTYNPEEVEPPFSSVSRPMLLETWRLPPGVNFVVPFAPDHRSR
jgi:hypothetical protein